MVQVLQLFGTTGGWSNRTADPNWRAAILQTDGSFGRGFATYFKESWERANGGQTTITGSETIVMERITGVSFEEMSADLKLGVQSQIRELTEVKGARVILIAAHSEDTFKILQIADEMLIDDVLWLVMDPNALPVSSLQTIRNGIFGFADRTPDYRQVRNYL